jgi:hypothetical protein
LTNLALRLVSAEVIAASLSPSGTNSYDLNLKLNPAQQTASVRPVATLDFLAVSNYHSAIVQVGGGQLMALQSTGRLITNGTTIGGRVFVVGREPVLEMAGGTPPQVILYGRLRDVEVARRNRTLPGVSAKQTNSAWHHASYAKSAMKLASVCGRRAGKVERRAERSA